MVGTGAGATLAHHPWTRLLWLETAGTAVLFAPGAAFECSAEAAQAICDREMLRSVGLRLAADQPDLLLELLNRGHLILEAV